MMTKREINFFSETLSSGNFTEFLNLFIPGLYDKGTIVTDVLDPNLRKIDTWAKTVDEQFNKICGQNIEGFIEDVGTKKENNFYLSKNKNGLYLCNGETSSTDPDDTVAFTKMDINTIYELITSLQTSNDKKLDKGTVPASLNSAEKIVAALQGNGGLKFDENLLYLNDEGTKKVGYYYLDRLADGIFECLEQTEETVNNSAKFRDISNKASADRLDNLSKDIFQYQNVEITSSYQIQVLEGYKYLDIAVYPTSTWKREDTVIQINLDTLKYDQSYHTPLIMCLSGGVYQVERLRYQKSTKTINLYKWSSTEKSFFLAYTYFHN